MAERQIFDRLSVGTCYYPEHWPKELWKEDLERMLSHGIRTIRIAEFAWSKFELTEGTFDFSFFDGFMDLVETTPMKVIFCTPTATPPAWLTEKYPEVLNARKVGVLIRHGMRRQYNYNSPVYRKLSKRIVEKIASHYGKRMSIIGWQIDNELNCENDMFYSASDSVAFRSFLKEKYGTLDALNDAWGTVFWNQTYTDWDEIFVPRTTNNDLINPHQHLDYIRFISESALSYCSLQAEIIRKYKKENDFITTNGMFGNMDNHMMTDSSLDIYMYDSYPNFATNEVNEWSGLRDRRWSRSLSLVRSICPHFGVMEQQSGSNGWVHNIPAPLPKPGQMTLWAMQSIAHGADYISFFRWRTCTFGTEIYWNGLLPWSNRNNRVLDEAAALSKTLDSVEGIAGSRYIADIAIVRDYDNDWDARIDMTHGKLLDISDMGIFKASELTHSPADYLDLKDDTKMESLLRYKALFYPHPYIMTEKRAGLLRDYVKEGGTLILGARTGVKDMNGRCPMRLLPGLLRDVAGVDVFEYSNIGPNEEDIRFTLNGTELRAEGFTDYIRAEGDTDVLSVFETGDVKGLPSLTCHRLGRGRCIYAASAINAGTAEALLKYLGLAGPYNDIIAIGPETELAVRELENGRKALFLLNFDSREQKAVLKKEMEDMVTKDTVKGEIVLEPYGTRILVF